MLAITKPVMAVTNSQRVDITRVSQPVSAMAITSAIS